MRPKITVAFCLGLAAMFPLHSSAQEIVAHRGASYDAPENTIAAFKLAWEQGADAIEADFHLTSDQQIVCIHDYDTARVCPASKSLMIADTDLETLRKLDVGSWKNKKFAGEKIPTLAEVLATVPPKKKVFVEIKTGPEILPELKKQLSKSSLKPEQVVLLCFKSEVIKQARKLMPKYRASWLVAYKMKQGGQQKSWSPSIEQVLKTLSDNGATGLGSQCPIEMMNQPFINSVEGAGVEFHAWTIDDPTQAEQLRLFGARSVTTNRPAFLQSRLKMVSDVQAVVD